MSNPNSQHKGFASLLYYKFIFRGEYSVKEIAPGLNIAPDTLYRYCRGELVFPPDLVPLLYQATRDREFIEFFTRPCSISIITEGGGMQGEGMLKAAQWLEDVAKLLSLTERYQSGDFGGTEYREFCEILSRLRGQLDGVDHEITNKMAPVWTAKDYSGK